jgi:hypothetical protein
MPAASFRCRAAYLTFRDDGMVVAMVNNSTELEQQNRHDDCQDERNALPEYQWIALASAGPLSYSCNRS